MERRVERAGAERWVQKSHFLVEREPLLCELHNLAGQWCRSGKLPQTVPIFLSFGAVALFLKCCALVFKFRESFRQRPNSAKSSGRCSQTQSIPSAAS